LAPEVLSLHMSDALGDSLRHRVMSRRRYVTWEN